MPKKESVAIGKLSEHRVITDASPEAQELNHKNRFGTMLEGGSVQLNLHEALYLLEKGKLQIKEGRKKISFDTLVEKATAAEPLFWIKYCVYRDMRGRGYVLKTALKFGADFRVYDRGVKPGEEHAKWLLYPVQESDALTWQDFAAKNRVAHSTKKNLLIGIVDEENSVTYYEIRWRRP